MTTLAQHWNGLIEFGRSWRATRRYGPLAKIIPPPAENDKTSLLQVFAVDGTEILRVNTITGYTLIRHHPDMVQVTDDTPFDEVAS